MRLREGLTEEAVRERKAQLAAESPKEGHIKLSEVAAFLKESGIPVARLVRATGGDRAMNPPISPMFEVTFVGNTRYLSEDVLGEEGLAILSDRYLGQPQPEKKAKEPKPAKEKKAKKAAAEERPEPQP
jgi:hypothetical protein